MTDQDYINFLVAAPKVCSATEAARVQPEPATAPAHDAFTRLLHRLEPDVDTLWSEAVGQVMRHEGMLVVDDATLDRSYARKDVEAEQACLRGKNTAVGSASRIYSLLNI